MKRFICILFLCWVSGAGLLAKRDILVIYDGKESVSNGYVGYCYLRDMLGHFDVDRINAVNANAYKHGMLKGIDFVFLMLDEMAPTFSHTMIHDLLGFQGDIIWGDRHVQEFLNQAHERYGFKVGETVKRKDWIVLYKNEDLPKEDPALNIVTVTDPANVFVYSTAKNKDGQTYPFQKRNEEREKVRH